MASVSAVRQGIATNLSTILGLRAFGFVPDQIQTPVAIVAPDTGSFLTYSTAFAGQADDMRFAVTVFVSRQWDRTSQATLDSYLDATSDDGVRTAIESDPTLGGIADDCRVLEARKYGQFDYEGIQFYGCEFLVSVYVSNFA